MQQTDQKTVNSSAFALPTYLPLDSFCLGGCSAKSFQMPGEAVETLSSKGSIRLCELRVIAGHLFGHGSKRCQPFGTAGFGLFFLLAIDFFLICWVPFFVFLFANIG